MNKQSKSTSSSKGKASRISTQRPKVQKRTTRKSPTTAYIKCDIGFGNTLFIRGEGTSILNWDKGQPLTFDEKEQGWCFHSSLEGPIEFKVLINDLQWSEGENFTLLPGGKHIFEPKFLY